MQIETSERLTQEEQQTVRVMQLLGDATRYKMLKIMLNERNMCVSDIASRLNVSVSAISQHFRSFELAGLVEKHRDGQRVCYQLSSDNDLMEYISTITRKNKED